MLNEMAGSDLHSFLQVDLKFDYTSLEFIGAALVVAVVTGLTAGVFPAILLSKLRTTNILANRRAIGARSSFSRNPCRVAR